MSKTAKKHAPDTLNQTVQKQLRRAEMEPGERRIRRVELRKQTGIQNVGGAR